MGLNEFEKYLQQSFNQDVQPKRIEETIYFCKEIMREHKALKEEPRTSFLGYLSDVFRFEGLSILGLQAVTLLVVCFTISSVANIPEYIPIFIPIFVLAATPIFFKSQFYKMNEIEAVTRASGAQIILAKLILAGAANLVCITVLLGLEISLQGSYREIGQMVLYCLVPYLVCMAAMLRLIRLCKRDSVSVYTVSVLSSCICWGISAKVFPWLYEASATGLWIVAFLIFAAFFIKEVNFILEMRKEGKMYGIIA